ncbi:uncharacterized protein LOC118416755 [Branchiostoma floridae]|uniref:Mannosyltransferase n=1 Tax=Branchiostoma floridae TaxID=7739 RepID=A0A9J7L7V8_BRAFL|nr:uncharacterized protein LOC118416755 [Branchiostoma floridae]
MARTTKRNSKRRNLAVTQQKQTAQGSKDSPQATKGSITSRGEGEPCSELPLFPEWTCYAVCMVTMLVRVHIATKHDWILHPDEIFQSVEVAYSEVYGYGFRSYEFGPVPRENDTSVGFGVEAERAAGMYAMRSFMYPRFLATMMMMVEGAGLQVSPFLAARIGHAIVSSMLPLAVYRLTLKMYGCDDVANMATILVALSDHLIILGTHTLINSFLSPFFFLGIAAIIPISKNTLEHTDSNENAHNSSFQLAWGVVLGLICYIRVDASLYLGVILMSMTLATQSNLKTMLGQFARSGIGMLLGFAEGALDDYLCYGYWFISPVQWAKFNLFNDYTTLIFGQEDAMFYVRHLLVDSPFLSLVMASSVTMLVYTALPNCPRCWFRLSELISRSKGLLHSEQIPSTDNYSDTWELLSPIRLLAALALLLSFYVAKGHKEVRFLHNWIVLLLVLCSGCLVKTLKSVLRNRTAARYVLYCLCGVLTATTYVTFPSLEDGSIKSWSFGHHGDSGHVNRALSFIGRQRDTTGVFMDYPVYMTGGYTILRRDVPIIGKVQHEYREWSQKERTSLPATFTFAGAAEVSVASFSRVAFLASEKNWLLLIRRLIDYPVYNYAIVPEGRTFLRTGFSMVERFGTVVVLRRNDSAEEIVALQKLRRKIPIGPNASVLEGEAKTLLTLGRADMAVERLQAAIDLEPTRTSAQQLLRSAVKAKSRHSTESSKFREQMPRAAT